MLSKKVEDALNKQINEEMYSVYIYLAMASYAEEKNLAGFAHWFKVQVQEEWMHLMKIQKHILDRGGSISFKAVKAPPQKWGTPLSLVEDAARHEENITQCFNELMDVVVAEKDYAAHNLVNWFIDEQVEEESTAHTVVEKVKLAGDNGAALLMLDNELGQRAPIQNPFDGG